MFKARVRPASITLVLLTGEVNMQTFLGVLSLLLGGANVIQFLIAMSTGSSLKAKAQADFNTWFRVAEIADQIAENPAKAAELIREVSGIATTARNEIKAYSREKLDFVPFNDPAYQAGPNPAPSQSFWQKLKSAFTPK